MDQQDPNGEEEHSGSGAPIHRYEARAAPFEPALGDPSLIETVDAHIEANLGDPESVLHQIASDVVHIDIHFVRPDDERPFHTLVTSGMAERPMAAPPELGDAEFPELVLSLPAEWPLDQEASYDERNYWPLRLLQSLAAFPHRYDSWLWEGHTLHNGNPPEPYAEGTGLCCALLLPPLLVPDDFRTMVLGDRHIHFWAVIPIHEDEMRLKLDHGTPALVKLLDAAEVTELLDPRRPSVAP